MMCCCGGAPIGQQHDLLGAGGINAYAEKLHALFPVVWDTG